MNQCLFCAIIKGEIKGDIIYQDDLVVAFRDINPKAPVHILIVPRKHVETLLDLEQRDKPIIGDVFYRAAQLAKDQGISKEGFRVVLNNGPGAGQSVYHIHFHLMGGRPFTWPPG